MSIESRDSKRGGTQVAWTLQPISDLFYRPSRRISRAGFDSIVGSSEQSESAFSIRIFSIDISLGFLVFSSVNSIACVSRSIIDFHLICLNVWHSKASIPIAVFGTSSGWRKKLSNTAGLMSVSQSCQVSVTSPLRPLLPERVGRPRVVGLLRERVRRAGRGLSCGGGGGTAVRPFALG